MLGTEAVEDTSVSPSIDGSDKQVHTHHRIGLIVIQLFVLRPLCVEDGYVTVSSHEPSAGLSNSPNTD